MAKNVKITASLMCTNIRFIERDIKILEKEGIDWLHFDIMDGTFVPNFGLSITQMAELRILTKLPFDVHMMAVEPIRFVEKLVEAGADIITVHAEACKNLKETIAKIKSYNKKVGVALNPMTPFSLISKHLDSIDVILFMCTNPGFTSQKFIPEVVKKIGDFTKVIKEKNLKIDIAVDGGINPSTVPALARAGANVFVGGTTGLFHSNSTYKESIERLREAAKSNIIETSVAK